MANGLSRDSIPTGILSLKGYKRDGLYIPSQGVQSFARFVKRTATNSVLDIINPYTDSAIRILSIYTKAANINYKITGDFIDLTVTTAIQNFEYLIIGAGRKFTITPTQPLDSLMIVAQEIDLTDSFDL